MKFLNIEHFWRINNFLRNLNLGLYILKGDLEAYSCELVGADRALSLRLEREILDHLIQSSKSDSSSPCDLLYKRSRRKTLNYLFLTLSHMYPLHDFRLVETLSRFSHIGWDDFEHMYQTNFHSADSKWSLSNDDGLFDCMHKTIDEVVKLADCEIYCFKPDSYEDPFAEDEALWSFHVFFYNPKLESVVIFRCYELCNKVLALMNTELFDEDNFLTDTDTEDTELFDANNFFMDTDEDKLALNPKPDEGEHKELLIIFCITFFTYALLVINNIVPDAHGH